MKKLLSALTIMVLAVLLVACGPRTPAKHEVTFDSVGGSPVGKKIVEHGGKLAKPTPDPIKDGFTFEFWMNGTTEFDFNTEIKEDLTLTANWKAVPIEKVTITFNADGGKLEDKTAIDPIEVESGKKIANPGNPTKEGFVFKHWALEGKLEVAYDFNLEVVSALDLVAVWTAKPTEPVLAYDYNFSKLSKVTGYVSDETEFEVANEVSNTNDTFIRMNSQISGREGNNGVVLGIREGNSWDHPYLISPKLNKITKVEFTTYNWNKEQEQNIDYATNIFIQTSSDGTTWKDLNDFKESWNIGADGKNVISVDLDGTDQYIRLFIKSAGPQEMIPVQKPFYAQYRIIVSQFKAWN